jgi:hypothetical protein
MSFMAINDGVCNERLWQYGDIQKWKDLKKLLCKVENEGFTYY